MLVLCPQCSGDGCTACDDLGYTTRGDADALRRAHRTDVRDLPVRALRARARSLGVELD